MREQFKNETETEINEYNNNLNNNSLDIFLSSALEEAKRPITLNDVKSYNINRFKAE